MAKAIKVLADWAPSSCAPACRRRAGSAGRARPWACSTAIRSAGTRANLATPPIVFVYELKRDLNLYLRTGRRKRGSRPWPTSSPSTGERQEGAALRPGPVPRRQQHAAVTCRSCEYRSARAMDLLAARTRGLDAYMSQHKLDAVRVSRHGGLRHRRQGGLSQRPGAGGLHARRRRQEDAGLSARPHLRRAAPGASTSCCGWPTPTSRLQALAGRRRGCRLLAIVGVTPPSTRSAAPLVAEDSGLAT